jgi:hypothetical protein
MYWTILTKLYYVIYVEMFSMHRRVAQLGMGKPEWIICFQYRYLYLSSLLYVVHNVHLKGP